ncbi:helix-turn-helix domain-containing protein [Megasphaera cerevisiae]|nr:helix-turn-helix transcriptional regulator [Megasphaera cerevisiae]SKA11181.1 Helix-turn-helix domain-containing protein [Megasphaera cerevisiae DSM 20462]
MNILKQLREKKGITQEEMAIKLGYKGKSGYCHLENGNVRMTSDIARKIKDILQLTDKEMVKIFFDPKV